MFVKTFIFDLDDTLIPCERYYQQRIANFFVFLDSELSYFTPTVVAVAKAVETENARLIGEQGGFFEDIFPKSLVNTYVALAQAAGIPVKKELEKRFRDIGESVFDETNYNDTLYPHAKETLDFLVDMGDELILYTKGPPDVQMRKVSGNGLLKYFPHPIITHQKNADEFLRIIGDRDRSRTYKVGNSVRSDVNPSTEAGIRVFYIPSHSNWSYESDHNGIERKELVCQAESIRDLQRVYPLLDTAWDSLTLARQELR